MKQGRWVRALAAFGAMLGTVLGSMTASACARRPEAAEAPARAPRRGAVVPGISVLLEDSIHIVRGKRVGLLADEGATDAAGVADAALLRTDPRAVDAGVQLVRALDPATAPVADSALDGLDVILVDLQDIGSRTWTRAGVVVAALRAAARRGMAVVVLDRPNPLGGTRVEGPMLDTALASGDRSPGTATARAEALYPLPLRHGMTPGELALFYDDRLAIHAAPRVLAMRGWRRSMWQDETGLPWTRPAADLPTLESALAYAAVVPLEATSVSVGRGTAEPFQRIGAPWLRARELARLLADHELSGVRFEEESFTPDAPSDGKYAGRRLPGVRVVITDRDRFQTARVGAALVWALAKLHADSLRVDTLEFDRRIGSSAVRRALLAGDDPDAVIDRELPGVIASERRSRPLRLYR